MLEFMQSAEFLIVFGQIAKSANDLVGTKQSEINGFGPSAVGRHGRIKIIIDYKRI